MNPEIHATLTTWAAAFGASDGAAIAALYTEDAIFIGGLGGIHVGPAAIAKYFADNVSRFTITFRDVVEKPRGDDEVVVAMIGAITRPDAPTADYRFLQLHVRTPQGWRIAAHHGSKKTEQL
jgi:uncharacterized protein (TIGR02246 family)